MFTANEIFKILNLINTWVKTKYIDHFKKQDSINVGQQMMYWVLKRYLEVSDAKWIVHGQISTISENKFKGRIVEIQRSEARPVLKEDVRKMSTDELT